MFNSQCRIDRKGSWGGQVHFVLSTQDKLVTHSEDVLLQDIHDVKVVIRW